MEFSLVDRILETQVDKRGGLVRNMKLVKWKVRPRFYFFNFFILILLSNSVLSLMRRT